MHLNCHVVKIHLLEIYTLLCVLEFDSVIEQNIGVIKEEKNVV